MPKLTHNSKADMLKANGIAPNTRHYLPILFRGESARLEKRTERVLVGKKGGKRSIYKNKKMSKGYSLGAEWPLSYLILKLIDTRW